MQSLNQLEKIAQNNIIDIYYGDETQINEEGYVPYGWQFPHEKVSTPVQKGVSINCLGFITRDNRFVYKTTQKKIDADFVLEQIENFSWTISKPTILVIDNAPVHRAKKIKEHIPFWSERGLTIFYLPTYSPQLNIAEILWNQLKYYWLKPKDYETADTLLLNVSLALAAIGNTLKINFSEFKNRSN